MRIQRAIQSGHCFKKLFFFLVFPFILISCSFQKLAVHATGGILINGLAVVNEESDLILAEQAIASNLKLLEALLKSDPENERLLLMAAEGYTGYALGFVEDEDPARASKFYLRARDFALRALSRNKAFARGMDRDLARFEQALQAVKTKEVAALFWAANSWGSYINLNKSDVNALADLAKVEAMMRRALELNERFYYGGPHLFLGTLMASRPPMLGGNPKKAREHFEICLRINEEKYLLAKYFFARTYAVQVQDRKLFHKLLQEILRAPDDLLPDQRLANEIAKKKARALLAQEDDLFF